jgi:hypothetical protein
VLKYQLQQEHPMIELSSPTTDPTPIFEQFRGSYGSELLTAAVEHFGLFELLNGPSKSFEQLRQELQLERRPLIILLTALRAMKLVDADALDHYHLTKLANEHLVRDGEFFVGGYLGLAAQSPGVLELVARLRSNQPAQAERGDKGSAFIFREGQKSAMDEETSARRLTLALAGRAKNVAPVLAERLDIQQGTLLDVGGGSGIYSIACLRRNPRLHAIVFDRQEVLRVASEFAEQYGVSDRLQLQAGDMFSDQFPSADQILLSNILHDWDEPECLELVTRCAAALPSGGRLSIHDVFLSDAHDGPLPVALYSAALFSITQGRAYSAAEYRKWLTAAGLQVSAEVKTTLIHCGVLTGTKP